MSRLSVLDLSVGLLWCSTVHLSSGRGPPPIPGPEPQRFVRTEMGVHHTEHPPADQLPV